MGEKRLIKKSEMAKMKRGTLYYDDFSEFLMFRSLCNAGIINNINKKDSKEMKKYIGAKEVKAQPMTAYEASQKGYKTGESDRNRNGYEVEYKDGYKSWCPADVFEEAYHEGSIEDVSDGYHTFKELYLYRLLYNAAFFNELAKAGKVKVCKSYRHNDEEECFGGGWFIVMAELPTGQISNHYESKYWDLFKVPELETAWKWDGHTPMDVAKRIESYLLSQE